VAELLAVATLAAVGVAYAVGVSRMAKPRSRDVRNFVAAYVVLAVALVMPHGSLTAHMVQHVLLLVVAAPLLASGAPLPTLLWALPAGVQRARALGVWRACVRSHGRRWAVWAGAALVAQGAVMLAWHTPALYGAAVRHGALHVLQHASYVATATVFWWAVGLGSARRHGAAVPVLFAAALPGTLLGAGLTLASTPWYAEYPSLDDQQLAGVVMWGFAGLAYVLAAAGLFGLWLAGLERETPARPLVPATTGGTR
jgi:cytochrome c oxidase assembly factor CtaG